MNNITILTSFGAIKLAFEGDFLVSVSQAKTPDANNIIDETILNLVVECIEGKRNGQSIPVKLKGSLFQKKVWKAMRQIPMGQVISYSGLARQLGNVSATRAVASACSKNPCAIIIPCHRVIRRDRSVGKYFWGSEEKKILLAREGVSINTNGYVI